MKRVIITIQDGQTLFDFDGFPGRECEKEEDTIRLLLASLGVNTEVERSDNKREAEDEKDFEAETN